MKKQIMITLIFIFSIIVSYYVGFLHKNINYEKQIKNISNQKDDLLKNSIRLQDDNKILENTNNDLLYGDNIIDKNEKKCLKEAGSETTKIRTCIINSTEEWQKELLKYLELLKKSTTEEEYSIISDNHKNWIKQTERDSKVIQKFVFNHGGTMFYYLADDDYKQIIKTRAILMKWIYCVHTDCFMNNENSKETP